MTQIHNDLEIVVLQQGNGRFEWRLYRDDGTILAKGRASNVLQARSDAFRSRSQTPTRWASRVSSPCVNYDT
jgi:hypothetical protein